MKCVNINDCEIRISLSASCVQFMYCLFSSITVASSHGGAILFESTGSINCYRSTFYNISVGDSYNGGSIYSTGISTNSSFCCFIRSRAAIGGAVNIAGSNYFEYNSMSLCYSSNQDNLRISNGFHFQQFLNSTYNSAKGDAPGFELYQTKGTNINYIHIHSNAGSGALTLWTVTSGNSDINNVNIVNCSATAGLIYLSNTWTMRKMNFFGNTGSAFHTGASPYILLIECSFDISVSSQAYLSTTLCSFLTTPIPFTLSGFQCYEQRLITNKTPFSSLSYPYFLFNIMIL